MEDFSPRDSRRVAFQLGVIQEHSEWFRMLEDRNLTSHTYNEATADARTILVALAFQMGSLDTTTIQGA